MCVNDLSLYSYFLVILLKIVFTWPLLLVLSPALFSPILSLLFFPLCFFLANVFKISNSQPTLRIPPLNNFFFFLMQP